MFLFHQGILEFNLKVLRNFVILDRSRCFGNLVSSVVGDVLRLTRYGLPIESFLSNGLNLGIVQPTESGDCIPNSIG